MFVYGCVCVFVWNSNFIEGRDANAMVMMMKTMDISWPSNEIQLQLNNSQRLCGYYVLALALSHCVVIQPVIRDKIS
jgi:hypothetical protein